MDYYLYTHSNDSGIFYVGKGCKDRAKEKHLSRRSNEWHKAAEGGYTTKIEANGTEKDIFALEKIVIKSLVEQGIKLVNKINNPNVKIIWSDSIKPHRRQQALKTHQKLRWKKANNFHITKLDRPSIELSKEDKIRRKAQRVEYWSNRQSLEAQNT